MKLVSCVGLLMVLPAIGLLIKKNNSVPEQRVEVNNYTAVSEKKDYQSPIARSSFKKMKAYVVKPK